MNPQEEMRLECLRLALQCGPVDVVEVAEEYYQFLSRAKPKPEKKPTKRRKQ